MIVKPSSTLALQVKGTDGDSQTILPHGICVDDDN